MCGRAPLLCTGMKLSLLLLLHREVQMPNFSDILHQARMGTPAPITLATGSRALALCGAGGLSPFSVSLARAWHRCCFYPLTKARPARPAVSEFLLLGCVGGWGAPSLPFLPPTPEGRVESACLLEAAAITSGLGQVKGAWVTQHWAEKAEDSLRRTKSSFSNDRIF